MLKKGLLLFLRILVISHYLSIYLHLYILVNSLPLPPPRVCFFSRRDESRELSSNLKNHSHPCIYDLMLCLLLNLMSMLYLLTLFICYATVSPLLTYCPLPQNKLVAPVLSLPPSVQCLITWIHNNKQKKNINSFLLSVFLFIYFFVWSRPSSFLPLPPLKFFSSAFLLSLFIRILRVFTFFRRLSGICPRDIPLGLGFIYLSLRFSVCAVPPSKKKLKKINRGRETKGSGNTTVCHATKKKKKNLIMQRP